MGELALPGKAGVVLLGSSPCPHTLSGLPATSESTLVPLFPGKTKWAGVLALMNDSMALASTLLRGEGGRGQAWASWARCLQPQQSPHSAGCSLRGVPSNGDHVSPNQGLLDWQEPAAKNLPEKKKKDKVSMELLPSDGCCGYYTRLGKLKEWDCGQSTRNRSGGFST